MPNLTAEQQALFESGKLLPLMEDFYTIQGEGYNTGQAAYFIRLGGCDVGCHWCDVKESWNAELHPLTSTNEIVRRAAQYPAKAVVITGGEPLIYNLDELCSQLRAEGIRIFLETSGAYPVSGSFDWVCVSPKKFKGPRPEMLLLADELKVIVFNKSDFDWAEEHAANTLHDCRLYLQPEWSKSDTILPEIIEYVKQHPNWQISVQTHKFMHIP
jgi:7-carboxy-7-deazaguanine synthase